MEFGGIWWGFFSNFPHQQQGNLNSVLVGLLEASSDIIKNSHYKSLEWTSINQTHSIFLEAKWVPAEGKCWNWHLTEMDQQSPPTSQLWLWQLWSKRCLLLTPSLPLPPLSRSLPFSSSWSSLLWLIQSPVSSCLRPSSPLLPLGTSLSIIDFSKSG